MENNPDQRLTKRVLKPEVILPREEIEPFLKKRGYRKNEVGDYEGLTSDGTTRVIIQMNVNVPVVPGELELERRKNGVRAKIKRLPETKPGVHIFYLSTKEEESNGVDLVPKSAKLSQSRPFEDITSEWLEENVPLLNPKL